MNTEDFEKPTPSTVGLPPEPVPHVLTPAFVGYARLEQWMERCSHRHPVYVLPIIECGPDQGGLSVDTLLVVCQQHDEQGRVHYARLRVAEMTRCFGEPFGGDCQQREAAWRSLAAAIEEELTEREFTIEQATIAAPRELRLLEAISDNIRFDPATRLFRRLPT